MNFMQMRLAILDLSILKSSTVTCLRVLVAIFIAAQLLVSGCGREGQRSHVNEGSVDSKAETSAIAATKVGVSSEPPINGKRSAKTNLTKHRASALNCEGKWDGSEETHKITDWPYRDCFRTDPIDGRRIRLTRNAGADVSWEKGTGWNGGNALRVRPPDGSQGRKQGFAGLGELNFHSVRTKRLNIRYLFRYNGNWARHSQFTKWEIAVKYDYSNPGRPERISSCGRGMVIGRVDPSSGRQDVSVSQGVCTLKESVANKSGWSIGPKIREGEWISIESEFDLETGWYRTYITTQDGAYNETLHTEVNIGRGDYGAPAEKVPSPYWWGSIDCSAGCFWGWPDEGSVPRPDDTYIWYSHFVMNNQYIGPPAGFVKGQPGRR